eukprot:jgi/Psemu1/285686/fgenesh1_pg.99_\
MSAPSHQGQKEIPTNDVAGVLPMAELGQLHWVKRPLSTLSVLSTSEDIIDDDEAPGLWWPSLLFNDYDDFQDFFLDELKPENDAAETKGLILARMLQNMLQQKSIMISRLLGRPICDYVEIVEVSADTEIASNLEAHQAAEFVSFTRMPQEVHLSQMKPEAFIVKIQDSSIVDDQTKIIDDDLYMSYMLALDLAATKRMSGPQAPNQTLRSDFQNIGRAELARLPPTVKKLSDEAAISSSEPDSFASVQVRDTITEDCDFKGNIEENSRTHQSDEIMKKHEAQEDKNLSGEVHDPGKSESGPEACVMQEASTNNVFDVTNFENQNTVSDQVHQNCKGDRDPENGAESPRGTRFSANHANLPHGDNQDVQENSTASNDTNGNAGNREENRLESSELPQTETNIAASAGNLPNRNSGDTREDTFTSNNVNETFVDGEKSSAETIASAKSGMGCSANIADLLNDDGNHEQVDTETVQGTSGDSVRGNDEADTKDVPSSSSPSSATVVSHASEGQGSSYVAIKNSSPAFMTTTPSPTTTSFLSPTLHSYDEEDREYGMRGTNTSTMETASPATVSKSLEFSLPSPKKARNRGRGRPRKNAGIKGDDSFDNVCGKLEIVGWTIDHMMENYFRPNVTYDDIKMNPQWRGNKFFLSKAAFLSFLKDNYSWTEKKACTPRRKVGHKSNDLPLTPSNAPKNIDRAGSTVTPPSSIRPKRSRRASFCGDDNDTPVVRRKQCHFKSDLERDFYDFRKLIIKLQRKCGWKYVSGKTHSWHYVLPGCKTESQGGQHLIDFFFEESEVIQYCVDNDYYEKRKELGLEDTRMKSPGVMCQVDADRN